MKKQNNKKLSFSKLLVIFIMFWVVEVIIYAEISMFVLCDLSALYVLLGGVVTAGISAIITMMLKSKAENTVGGITYELAMQNNMNMCHDDTNESESSVG